MAGVPVRGAISHGSFVRSEFDENGAVIAGRPIIDAHRYEVQQQWIGIMMTPALREHVPDITAERCAVGRAASEPTAGTRFEVAIRALQIQPCAVPLEIASGRTTDFESFAVVPLRPTATDLQGLRDSLDEVRRKLDRLKQLAPDGRSQAKYRCSIDWLSRVRDDLVRSLGDHIGRPA
jgi:hypothetical protein